MLKFGYFLLWRLKRARKKRVYFWALFPYFKTLLTTLTNSALEHEIRMELATLTPFLSEASNQASTSSSPAIMLFLNDILDDNDDPKAC